MALKKFYWMMLVMPCFAQETDLVFPWVTNNAFQSQIVVNNLNEFTVTIDLTATRQEGETPATETIENLEIPPLGQWTRIAGEVFSALGEGAGYMVRLTSSSPNIEGAFVVRFGSSPSQANVFPASEAAPNLLFNYMPANQGGFAAPVLINMGDQTANVTYFAFQDGQEILPSDAPRTLRQIPPGKPHAELVRDLFPEATGDLIITVQSDQPLLGVAFLFNEKREPSMANATSIPVIPGKTYALASAHPVRAGDESWLLYEVAVHNRTGVNLAMTEVEIFADDTPLQSFSGGALNAITLTGNPVVPANSLNILYLAPRVRFDNVPQTLVSRISLSDDTTREVDTYISKQEIAVIGPPLKGNRWLAANALSNDTGHRRAVLLLESKLQLAQRFASDWVQLDDNDNTFAGPINQNQSYYCYGAELLAVGDGVVVQVRDGVPDSTPPGAPDGITLENLAGNFLVLDLGNNRFATYAHCIPGSFRVAEGDQVAKGQVLALLGNSGNSTEPHLHFHMTDKHPGIFGVAAQGIPYVFEAFVKEGEGQVEGEMPLNFDVISFPED